MHELFEAQVAKTPDAIAVVFEDRHLTYAQLNAEANRLAHHLKGLGVQVHSFVGCCLERSPEMIVTLLGILKAGGAYLAFDLSSPSNRLQSMLDDAQPAAIVVKSARQKAAIDQLVETALNRAVTVICLEQHDSAISFESAENLAASVTSESPAYACFTSGSTGRPKGLSIPHRGILRLVKNSNYISITSEDIFLQLAPISFDASTFEIWGALLNGAQLVVAAPKLLSPSELGLVIRKHRVSVLWLTAALFHLMVDYELDSLSDVRQVLAGGDVLSMAHVRKVLERLGEGRLINGYGPTENTTFTCCHSVTRASLRQSSIPIGRPISGTQCYILDNNMEPVPIGVRGELFTGGDGLALGYLNDATLTASKFIQNPFDPAMMLYRTGDFARYLSDGNIEFLGRVDDQVKIRGFRVELGDVEAVIRCHPAVRETAVVARKDAAGENSLIAYVSPAEVDGLLTFLKERLPSYMLPATFVFRDVIPLSESGKIDRRVLRALESAGASVSYVAPRTSDEETLASLWCEITGLKQIGIHDSFFDLGGHSLQVVRLIDKVNRTLNVRLTIADLFEYPTVAQMARAIHELAGTRSTYPAGVVPIRRGSRGHPIFCFPGLSGNAFQFRTLAEKLDTVRPVLGIDLHDLDAGASELTSMGRIAGIVIQRLRQVQPLGPYAVLGFSFGGNLAVEVARQLMADGQTLEFVMLLDARVPNSLRSPERLRRLATHLRIIRGLNVRESCGYILYRIQNRLFSLVRNALLPEDAIERRMLDISLACYEALNAHSPEVFPGQVIFLRATDPDISLEVADPSGTCGWSAICKGGVKVLPMIDCHHLDLLKEPNVAVPALHINDVLAEIDNAD